MNVQVIRKTRTKHSTTGELYLDATPECVTLEPPAIPDSTGNGFVCILPGTFPLTIRWSDRFQKPMPHVENVPNRTAIEVHNGNYARNTDGCCLVGQDYGNPFQPDFIRNSNVTLAALMNKLYSVAILQNPDSTEQERIWVVGTITYSEELT